MLTPKARFILNNPGISARDLVRKALRKRITLSTRYIYDVRKAAGRSALGWDAVSHAPLPENSAAPAPSQEGGNRNRQLLDLVSKHGLLWAKETLQRIEEALTT